MTDLIAYPGDSLEPHQGQSVGKWRIVKAEPAHVTGRWHKNSKRMLQLILEHQKPDGDYVTVEVFVDATYKLVDLLPFLNAAENLPDGIRIKMYNRERVPWAKDPERRPVVR